MLTNLFSFPALGRSKVTVWYSKNLADDMMLMMSLGKTAEIDLPKDFKLTDTHTPIVEYFTEDTKALEICEQTFHWMQGEVWSPNAEAREVISNADGIRHTSMSMGDIVQLDNRFFICQAVGFVEAFRMIDGVLTMPPKGIEVDL